MTLSVTEYTDTFVFQRNKRRRYEAIPYSGTWGGTTPVKIQYQLTTAAGAAITSWLDASDVVVGTNFLGNGILSFKTGVINQWSEWYKISFRTLDVANAVIDTQAVNFRFGVGCRVWLGGQSNVQFWSGASNPANATFDFQSVSGRGREGNRTVYTLGTAATSMASVGDGEKTLNDALSNAFGCVVNLYNAAIDSAALNKSFDLFLGSFRWHLPPTPLVDPGYSADIGFADLAATGGVELGIWQLGETESVQASRFLVPFESDEHKTSFKRMVAKYRKLSGSHFPVFTFPLGAVTIGVLTASLKDSHNRMREIFSDHLGDDIFSIGSGAYPYEHNGAKLTAWTLDAGNVYQSDETYAGSVVTQCIVDAGLGTEQGSKVALVANNDWFFDVGVTDRVFFYSDAGDPDTVFTNPGVWPVIRQSDPYHLTKAGYAALAQQVADAVISYSRTGAPGQTNGPTVIEGRYGRSDQTIVDLYINHDVSGSSLVAMGGALRTELFRVEDDGVAVAISSATIIGNNLIRLVLGAAVTGIGKFSHLADDGFDATTTNAWVGTPIASPTSGPCQDDNGRYLRPLSTRTSIAKYRGISL
tara:strand:+ start:3886 stop:5646 length:1761 start_codon:yes stop_codon:yes gene_type:complete